MITSKVSKERYEELLKNGVEISKGIIQAYGMNFISEDVEIQIDESANEIKVPKIDIEEVTKEENKTIKKTSKPKKKIKLLKRLLNQRRK